MKRPDIEHEGIITGISKSHIFVRIIQHSACAGCHAASLHDNRPKRKNYRG